jgi:hypothetical protein
MARIGIICPIDGAKISDEACLACRTGPPRAGEHCAYPYEMLRHMMDGSGRERAHVSATMLGGACPRQTWLQSRCDWHLDPGRAYAALRGTVGHAFMERHPEPGAIVEQRFEAVIDGITVTGQIDKIHPGNRRITDFKTKPEDKAPPSRPQPDHVMQLNVYRWLVNYGWPQDRIAIGDDRAWIPGEPAGIGIDELELVYWTFGWVKRIAVPLLPEDQVLAYIRTGAAAQTGSECPPVPPGMDPFRSTFCREWCSVRHACIAHLADDF